MKKLLIAALFFSLSTYASLELTDKEEEVLYSINRLNVARTQELLRSLSITTKAKECYLKEIDALINTYKPGSRQLSKSPYDLALVSLGTVATGCGSLFSFICFKSLYNSVKNKNELFNLGDNQVKRAITSGSFAVSFLASALWGVRAIVQGSTLTIGKNHLERLRRIRALIEQTQVI